MNETIHPLCVHLSQEVKSGVGPVQRAFDAYQQECFIERPGEFFSLELCGEAGELANLEKKRWKGNEIPHDRLADEAADVFIALMNYANARDIDLASAVCEKLTRIRPSRP
ncbi:MAG: hypothetical protein FGM33_00400 [Candidatus Kapabacteria bacterium]|nr:hypothetical protein [Candidatus Kapabacteria bacterium]